MRNRFLFALLICTCIQAQNAIDVYESTFKLKGTDEVSFFFGFAENDNIVLNFEEINGKEVKEVEVLETSGSSKFMDYKTTKIENKNIFVNDKGVYEFRFKNSTVKGRICKIKIQRIPGSAETAKFNTNWKWKTTFDTTYVAYTQDSLVGYDTIRYTERTKDLMNKRIEEIELCNKFVTLKSEGLIIGNNPRDFVPISLPQNEVYELQTKQVIGWAYWIGCGRESENFFSKNKDMIAGLAQIAIGTTSPLAAFAIGQVPNLFVPDGDGTPVRYAITNVPNRDYFLRGLQYRAFDSGFGKGGYKRFIDKNLCQGTYFICLQNESTFNKLDVNVKAVAVREICEYAYVNHPRIRVSPRYVTLHKKRMNIKTNRIRVNAE